MNKKSKKVELGVIKHSSLENNRAYLLRTKITKSHLNNRICQHCGVKTSTVTPSFYFVFNISLSCNINIPSFIGNLWWVLLLGNHLKKNGRSNNPGSDWTRPTIRKNLKFEKSPNWLMKEMQTLVGGKKSNPSAFSEIFTQVLTLWNFAVIFEKRPHKDFNFFSSINMDVARPD